MNQWAWVPEAAEKMEEAEEAWVVAVLRAAEFEEASA
jgi:hypothetical protein